MNPFGSFFQLFQVLFFGVFALGVAVFIATLVRAGKRSYRNSRSPRITSEATVVTKRTHVWGDHSHTNYYTTFQFASGDRMELEVPHNEFGDLVEGDKGKLTFQGTQFLNFERI